MITVIAPYKHAVEAHRNISSQNYPDVKLVTVDESKPLGEQIYDISKDSDNYFLVYEAGVIWAPDRLSRQLAKSPEASALKKVVRETVDGKLSFLTNDKGVVLETLIFKGGKLIPPFTCGFLLNIVSQISALTVLDEPNLYRKLVNQI